MRVFVVAGSPAARRPRHLSPQAGDYVIAADLGGQHALSWGWSINLLIGDLDSLPAALAAAIEREGIGTERAAARKDETDTELALARARELTPGEVILCGALGGRTDHLLANVLLLARPDLQSVHLSIVDGPETLCLLQADVGPTQLVITGAAGDLVSLLPLGNAAEGVTTDGLLYPLHAETLHLGSARGVSNVLTGPRGQVTLRRGQLLVIHNRMEDR